LKFDDEAVGAIVTNFFRLNLEAGQDQDDPGRAAVSREVTLRVSYEDLPKNFDSIFGGTLEEIITPFKLSGADYNDIANALEKFAKDAGAELEEQESDGLITISFPDRGPEIAFDQLTDT
jgi:NADPH-dependent glutamate synthase beta subunit-like oxidoreductase